MTSQLPSKPTSVRWWVFGLASVTSWLLYLHRYAWGVVKPSFNEVHRLPASQLGVIDGAFMAAYGIGQIPGGILGDWLGPRRVLFAIILLWSLMLPLLGVLQEFWLIVGVMAAFGLFQAAAYPVLSKTSRIWFPARYRTSVQGVITAMGRIGGACAPVILASLLMWVFGVPWQTVLLIIAVPGVALAIGVFIVFRDSPAAHPWTNRLEQELIGSQDSPSGERVKFRLNRASIFSFVVLLLYAASSTFADQLYVYWIPTFLREGKGLDNFTMGLFAPLPLLGGAVGGIIGGMLNDWLIRRVGSRRWGRSLIAFTGKALAGVLIFASIYVPDGRVVMVFLLACKFFGDWSLPTQWGTVTDISGRSAATVFAIVNSVGALGGTLAGPIIGKLRDSLGWEGLFTALAGVYLLAACCWIFIDCTRNLTEEIGNPESGNQETGIKVIP